MSEANGAYRALELVKKATVEATSDDFERIHATLDKILLACEALPVAIDRLTQTLVKFPKEILKEVLKFVVVIVCLVVAGDSAVKIVGYYFP